MNAEDSPAADPTPAPPATSAPAQTAQGDSLPVPIEAPTAPAAPGLGGRVVRVFLLIALLAVLSDLLFLALRPVPTGLHESIRRAPALKDLPDRPQQQGDFLQDHLRHPPSPRKVVRITVAPGRVTFEFELAVPRTHPAAERLAWAAPEQTGTGFCEDTFGVLLVDDSPLTGDELSYAPIEVDQPTQTLRYRVRGSRAIHGHHFRMEIKSRERGLARAASDAWRRTPAEPEWIARGLLTLGVPVPIGSPAAIPWAGLYLTAERPPDMEVVIKLNGVSLRTAEPVPDAASGEEVRLRRPAGQGRIFVQFGRAGEGADPPVNRVSRREVLQKLGGTDGRRALPWLIAQNLLTALLRFAPLVGFLVILRRQPDPSGLYRALARAVELVVLTLIIVDFTQLFRSWMYSGSGREVSAVVEGLWEQSFGRLYRYPVLGPGAFRIVPGVLGVLIPAAIVGAAANLHPIKSTIRARLLTTTVATCLTAALLAQVRAGNPAWAFVLTAVGALGFWIWLGFWALLRQLGGAHHAGATALLATAVTLAVGVLDAFTTGQGPAVKWVVWVQLAVYQLATAALLTGLVYLGYGIARVIGWGVGLPRWAWGLVFGLSVVSSIPGPALLGSTSAENWTNDLAWFPDLLGRFALAAWYVAPLWFLSDLGRRTLRLTEAARWVGVLAAAGLFYGIDLWIGMPITFLLGLAALTWFVRGPEFWAVLKPLVETPAGGTEVLTRVLDLKMAEASVRERRRALGAKVVAGELTVAAFHDQLRAAEKELNDLRAQAMVDGRPARDVAFALGPRDTAWGNGLHGARWSLLLAVPWLVVFLANYLVAPTEEYDAYPLWEFVTGAAAMLGKWAGFGFFFGYFYPYLRGQTGLTKGLYFCLILLLPPIPMLALGNATQGAWQATGFWSLQVFVHCVLLGLFGFDYVMLRVSHRDWRMLFDIHGLPSVGVTVSSVLAAVVATIFALLQAQATTLITAVLGLVLPQPPQLTQPPVRVGSEHDMRPPGVGR